MPYSDVLTIISQYWQEIRGLHVGGSDSVKTFPAYVWLGLWVLFKLNYLVWFPCNRILFICAKKETKMTFPASHSRLMDSNAVRRCHCCSDTPQKMTENGSIESRRPYKNRLCTEDTIGTRTHVPCSIRVKTVCRTGVPGRSGGAKTRRCRRTCGGTCRHPPYASNSRWDTSRRPISKH